MGVILRLWDHMGLYCGHGGGHMRVVGIFDVIYEWPFLKCDLQWLLGHVSSSSWASLDSA